MGSRNCGGHASGVCSPGSLERTRLPLCALAASEASRAPLTPAARSRAKAGRCKRSGGSRLGFPTPGAPLGAVGARGGRAGARRRLPPSSRAHEKDEAGDSGPGKSWRSGRRFWALPEWKLGRLQAPRDPPPPSRPPPLRQHPSARSDPGSRLHWQLGGPARPSPPQR